MSSVRSGYKDATIRNADALSIWMKLLRCNGVGVQSTPREIYLLCSGDLKLPREEFYETLRLLYLRGNVIRIEVGGKRYEYMIETHCELPLGVKVRDLDKLTSLARSR